jgi:hypothetical protein
LHSANGSRIGRLNRLRKKSTFVILSKAKNLSSI